MKSAVQERLRRVEGRHNALVRELRRTFARGELTESGACAIEGLRIVEEAIRSGLRFEAVFFSDAAQTKAERLLPQIGAHVETLVLPEKLFGGVVPSETPQGVAALVRMKEFSVDDVIRAGQPGASVRAAQAGRFCVRGRPLRPVACWWEKTRSARSTRRWCGRRRDRSFVCRSYGQNWPVSYPNCARTRFDYWQRLPTKGRR